MATPNRYAILLLDKDFNLKGHLEPFVSSVKWEWNRRGGCGRATLKIQGDHLRFDPEADDDVRIYLPDAGANTATLWYRGYVESATPQVSGGGVVGITITCVGYFEWLSRIIVQNAGVAKTFSSTEVSAIVDSLITDFIVANSNVTKGTIQASSFTPDTLSFKTTVKEAVRTLFDLVGTIEYGVDEDLVFFWYNEDSTINHKFHMAGGRVSNFKDRLEFSKIVNKVYFEGGETGGSVFVSTGQSLSSQNRYGLREKIISNNAINTTSVATQFINNFISRHANPERQLSIQVKNTTQRLEAALPIGAVSVYDPDNAQISAVYGTTGNGGSNKIYGKKISGGSGQLWGGGPKHQVDRIIYSLSPEDGRVDAEIQFGSSEAVSKASATIRQIETLQDTLRQRSV